MLFHHWLHMDSLVYISLKVQSRFKVMNIIKKFQFGHIDHYTHMLIIFPYKSRQRVAKAGIASPN